MSPDTALGSALCSARPCVPGRPLPAGVLSNWGVPRMPSSTQTFLFGRKVTAVRSSDSGLHGEIRTGVAQQIARKLGQQEAATLGESERDPGRIPDIRIPERGAVALAWLLSNWPPQERGTSTASPERPRGVGGRDCPRASEVLPSTCLASCPRGTAGNS